MKSAFLIAAVIAVVAAAAGPVFRHGADHVRLLGSACPENIAAMVANEAVRPDLRAASALIEGKATQGCWLEFNGLVYFKWEDGDDGTVRRSSFKDEPEA